MLSFSTSVWYNCNQYETQHHLKAQPDRTKISAGDSPLKVTRCHKHNDSYSTLQGTNISPKNGILKMIFLFPRWDMLIPWRVYGIACIWKGNKSTRMLTNSPPSPTRVAWPATFQKQDQNKLFSKLFRSFFFALSCHSLHDGGASC